MTSHYKATSEHTDEAERLLIPPFKPMNTQNNTENLYPAGYIGYKIRKIMKGMPEGTQSELRDGEVRFVKGVMMDGEGKAHYPDNRHAVTGAKAAEKDQSLLVWLDQVVTQRDQLKAQRDELLEALKAAMAALSQTVQWSDAGGSIKIIQGDCAVARKFLNAVIAKIEGSAKS